MDGFEKRVILGMGKPEGQDRHIYHILIRNVRKRPEYKGTLRGCERLLSACHSLEGGGRASPEGLTDSGRPCTTGLSVSGFFDTLGLFPWGRGVYSEVKEGTFPRGEPGSL